MKYMLKSFHPKIQRHESTLSGVSALINSLHVNPIKKEVKYPGLTENRPKPIRQQLNIQ